MKELSQTKLVFPVLESKTNEISKPPKTHTKTKSLHDYGGFRKKSKDHQENNYKSKVDSFMNFMEKEFGQNYDLDRNNHSGFGSELDIKEEDNRRVSNLIIPSERQSINNKSGLPSGRDLNPRILNRKRRGGSKLPNEDLEKIKEIVVVAEKARSEDQLKHFKPFRILEAINEKSLKEKDGQEPPKTDRKQPTVRRKVEGKDSSLKDLFNNHLKENKLNSQIYQDYCSKKIEDMRKTIKAKVEQVNGAAEKINHLIRIKESGPNELSDKNHRLFLQNCSKIQQENIVKNLQEMIKQDILINHKTFTQAKEKVLKTHQSVPHSKENSEDEEEEKSERLALREKKTTRFSSSFASRDPNMDSNGRLLEKKPLQKYPSLLLSSPNISHKGYHISRFRRGISYKELKPILKQGVSINNFYKDEMSLKLSSIKIAPNDINLDTEEGKKKKEDILFKNHISRFSAQYRTCSKIIHKPPTREDPHLFHCFNEERDEHSLVLYGGMGYQEFTDLWSIPLPTKLFSSDKWDHHPVKFDSLISETASLFQCTLTKKDKGSKAYLFGGKLKQEGSDAFDVHNNCIYSLDFETRVCSKLTTQTASTPGGRRFHTSNMIEGCMIIIGGVNQRDEPSDQVWKFKFHKEKGGAETGSWSKFSIVVEGVTEQFLTSSLYHHSSATVPNTSKSKHANRVMDR